MNYRIVEVTQGPRTWFYVDRKVPWWRGGWRRETWLMDQAWVRFATLDEARAHVDKHFSPVVERVLPAWRMK